MNVNDDRMIEFETQLANHGVRGALAWLNGGAQYRYTALYLVDGAVLKNIYVFDREDPIDKPYLNTASNDSYCDLVMDTEQAVIVTDALHDARTAGHPYSTVIRSFCGLPLRRADGSACGALCHFDGQPRELEALQRAMLEAAGKALSKALQQISTL